MPVARNLSLPSSIENRNKKRPDTLFNRSSTEVQGSGHCTIQRSKPVNLTLQKVSRPKFLTTAPVRPTAVVESLPVKNVNNNNYVCSGEISDKNESSSAVAENTNADEIVMGVDTTATRGGTLSQPCLSITNIGATQIFPHLFLGSQKDVVDENMMRSNGITYVLNVSKTCTKPEFIEDAHFYRISVHDSYQEKITPHMIEAIEFIEKVRKLNQRVIVHCLAGVSRSATVAIAYVMHYLRISFEEAYRFVKEKRPSISPNFNFLGQLMEFEKSLRQSGHLTCKRTGSVSEESEDDSIPKFSCHEADDAVSTTMTTSTTTTKRASLKLNFFESKSDCPLVMPVTCSFKCTTQATAPCQATGTTIRISPTSSLSKRRNGPSSFKGAFSLGTNSPCNPSSNKLSESAVPKFLDGKSPFHGPGLVVDVTVDAPPATPRVCDASRRLGSDGCEKYESMQCDSESCSDAFSPFRKHDTVVAIRDESMDCTDSLNVLGDIHKKPRTAPNTPVIGRSKSEKTPPWRLGQLSKPQTLPRHRRCASGGGITAEILQSSFSMKRRFVAQSERSSSIEDLNTKERSLSSPMMWEQGAHVKRVASFSGSYYNHSEPSTRAPHKFVSVNARSPKILRKSFQLNVRPVYSHSNQSKGLKSEDAAAPISTPSVLDMNAPAPVFDCTHTMSENKDRLKLSVGGIADETTAIKEGTTPEIETDDTFIHSMSPLTLSSPNVDADGAPRFPTSGKMDLTSPATCPVMSTRDPFTRSDSPPQFLCKGSFTYSSNKGRSRIDVKTSQTTILSPPESLKLKWRCNSNRRRQSVDSGYLSSQNSSQASSSFTSPTSQQSIFGVGSIVHDSFPEIPVDNDARTPSPSTCHVEGALFPSDDVTNSNSDGETHKSNVRQRNAMELVSCS